MNKSELVAALAEKANVTKKDAEGVLNAATKSVIDCGIKNTTFII